MKLKIAKISFIVIVTFIVISCGELAVINGMYIAEGFENTSDTLILYGDGNYEHKIWDKTRGRKIINNIGRWENPSGKIICYEFLFNEDDILYYHDSIDYSRALGIQTFSLHLIRNGFVINADLDMHYRKVNRYSE